jgi:spore germination protein YaaH/putative cell wall-binding protein
VLVVAGRRTPPRPPEQTIPVTRAAAAILSLVLLLSSVAVEPVLAADPSGLPELPAELNRPSVMAEMDALHADDVLTLEPGGTPQPLAEVGGIGTMGSGGIATFATGPGGPLPNALSSEVLGFLPYWMLSDPDVLNELRYELLSTIAYYDAVLDENGSIIRSGPGWTGWNSAAMTSVINAAHARGVKVVLTVAMHGWDATGEARMPVMLNSAANRQRAVNEIAAEVKARNVDGVNVDFEPVPPALRSQFTAFVRELKAGLIAAGARSYLTVDTMAGAASWSTGYDVNALTASGAADAIMVMAYDLSWSGSARAGGVAPIESPYIFDVTDSLGDHLAAGVNPAKMIWGVPWYGRTWPTTSGDLNSPTRAGTSTAWTYTQAVAQATERGWRWDPVGRVPWYSWQNSGWWQGYYDDQTSLKIKYDLIKSTNLAGVGIWALGMDVGRTELASSLAGGFARRAIRYGGADRYGTAAAVSAAFPTGVPVVYIATGQNYPDALAAGPAAAKNGGPILLAERNRLTDPTILALQRLQPKWIVIIGGPNAISPAVEEALKAYTPGQVNRVNGVDRYDTAAGIAQSHFPSADVVYLATGENYPDALPGGNAAAIEDGPILLVTHDTMPAATLAQIERLKPDRVVALGGPGVIGDSVLDAAAQWGATTTRLAGADRYATSVEISKSLWSSASSVYIATGAFFPDGLAAAALAARDGAPLLLVKGGIVPDVVLNELRRLEPQRIVIIGGPAAVPDGTRDALLYY